MSEHKYNLFSHQNMMDGRTLKRRQEGNDITPKGLIIKDASSQILSLLHTSFHQNM